VTQFPIEIQVLRTEGTQLELKSELELELELGQVVAQITRTVLGTARLKADYRPQGMQFASIKLEALPRQRQLL